MQNKSTIAVVLSILVLFAVLSFGILFTDEFPHDCPGEQCEICLTLHRHQDNLRLLCGVAGTYPIVITIGWHLIRTLSLISVDGTGFNLILFKVKFSN